MLFDKYLTKIQSRVSKRMQSRKGVYIVPTTMGIYLSVLIFLLFMMALSYGNNTLLFYVFSLFSIYSFSMLFNNFNLYWIEPKNIHINDCFAHETALVQLQVENKASINSQEIEFSVKNQGSWEKIGEFDIPSKSHKLIKLQKKFSKRGRHQIERIQLRTFYPLAIFRSWTFRKMNNNFFVYPERKGKSLSYFFETNRNFLDGYNEFQKHKKYDTGMQTKNIDWKIFSRMDKLLLKEYQDLYDNKITFSIEKTPGQDIEEKLSQVCLWVEEAHRLGLSFSIEELTLIENDADYLKKVFQGLATYA